MSPKTLVAFLAGLVVASGITFFVMRKPQPAAQPPAVQQAAPTPVPEAASPAPAETASDAMASDVPSTQARNAPAQAHHSQPLGAVRHQHQPQVIAQVQTPAPVSTQPAAQPAPVATPEQPKPQPDPPAETRSVVPPPPAPPPAEEPKPNTVTIPQGTSFTVRMGETLNTERNHDGDAFVATLDQPVVVDGFVIAERGARARGRVVQSMRSGRVQGLAELNLELTEVMTSDGQHLKLNTDLYKRQAASTKKTDAAKVGGGAAIGAIIGAIAGGGKGAAIGAGAGGAAGAGDVLLTRGKPAEVPVETRVSFRLKDPVTLTEQLH
jgi:hypothetical protein